MDFILTISCPDRVGLVHDVTAFFKANQLNIVELDQYVDRHQSRFFMRIEFSLTVLMQPSGDGFPAFNGPIGGETGDADHTSEILERLQPFMKQLNTGTEWHLHARNERVRAALFVTRESHCLLDILSRSFDGELQVDIPLIISNHTDLAHIAERFDIPFHHVPVTKEKKSAAEAKAMELLTAAQVDLVVLAKYMQILSPAFIAAYRNRIINIHHSFLPAFPGSKPYHSAYYRGVKIIGATSHFVTEELDAGPIIEQDVIRIKHSDSIEDLKRKGKEVEKNVLSRAIWYYADRRVLGYGNKTIIL